MSSQQTNTVAILATNGFEQIELTSPKQALEDAGMATQIVSDQDGEIQGSTTLTKATDSRSTRS